MRGLRKSGASIDRIFSQLDLKRFNFQNPEAYLPMTVLYDSLQKVKSDQAVSNMAATFYSGSQMDELGDLGNFLADRPDLLTVILDGIKYESVLQTNTKCQLEINGKLAKFYTVHLDPMSEGRVIAEEIAFALALNIFRTVLGKNWRPIELQIPGYSAKWIEAVIPIDNTTLTYGCEHYGWIFETELLSNSNIICKTKNIAPPESNHSNLSDSINSLLNSLSDGSLPTQTDFSAYLNMSERTIIRNLHTEGTSFSSILNRYFFTKSLKLLADNNISVLEVSRKLGYANAPNFIRAFKQWTNTTPDQYRS